MANPVASGVEIDLISPEKDYQGNMEVSMKIANSSDSHFCKHYCKFFRGCPLFSPVDTFAVLYKNNEEIQVSQTSVINGKLNLVC